MTLIYRTLSVLLYLFSAILAVLLVILIPVSLTQPALWLPVFILVAVVLYTWHSRRFRKTVLERQMIVPRRRKDWIKVNGYVSLFFCFLNIASYFTIRKDPKKIMDQYREMMSNMSMEVPKQMNEQALISAATFVLVIALALMLHILWTFALLKKNDAFFAEQQ